MVIRDREDGYGVVTRWAHWLGALLFFFLFGLGFWMVGLDYYSPYYTRAPDLHRSVGVLFAVFIVARCLWVSFNTHPSIDELTPAERVTATVVQWSFYPLIIAICISGYLISTTDGRPVDVFGLVSLPSIVTDKEWTDTAGNLHRWIAYTTTGLALLHASAALKHHFWDRNAILKRMICGPAKKLS